MYFLSATHRDSPFFYDDLCGGHYGNSYLYDMPGFCKGACGVSGEESRAGRGDVCSQKHTMKPMTAPGGGSIPPPPHHWNDLLPDNLCRRHNFLLLVPFPFRQRPKGRRPVFVTLLKIWTITARPCTRNWLWRICTRCWNKCATVSVDETMKWLVGLNWNKLKENSSKWRLQRWILS